ncbi:MAG: hypothetical protein ACOH2R_17315 [Pseudomonas sp.]
MSQLTDALRKSLAELEERMKMADNAHQAARSTFAHFEGSSGSALWFKLRQEVDNTLTHARVLEAHWHRIKADLLDRQAKDKE